MEPRVRIDTKSQVTETIDFLYKVKAENGSVIEKAERIFQRWPAIRGAFEVSYCNPNENTYEILLNSYSLFSICTSPSHPVGHVVFQGDFTTTTGGSLSYLTANDSKQDLNFSDCH